MSDVLPDLGDSPVLPSVGDDGEIQAGLSIDPRVDFDRPKKRPPSRRRRFLRQFMIFLAVSIPVDSLIIVAILIAVGVIDVTTLALYRRLCVASLSQPRLAYSQYMGPTITSAVITGEVNRNWGSLGQVNGATMPMTSSGPRQSLDLMDSSQARACPISTPGGEISHFIWSPDGKQIAYAAGQKDDSGTTTLYALDINTLTERPLAEVKQAQPLAWTADGKQILYFLLNSNHADLFSVDADGTNNHLVEASLPYGFSLSPDATYLTYTNGSGLGISKLDGTGFHYLSTQNPQQNQYAWSPDDKSLAFGIFGALNVIDADGTHSHQLAQLTTASMTWTRDGKAIIFVGYPTSTASTPAFPQLYLVNADGSNLHVIGHDFTQPAELSLSPDNNWLATLIRNPTGMAQIAEVKTDGSQVRTGSRQPALYTQVAWQPDPAQTPVSLDLVSSDPAATPVSLAATPPPTVPAMAAGSASLSGAQMSGGQLAPTPTVAHHTTWNVQFSPDGKSLLSVTDDGVAHLWDALTGNFIRDLNYVGSVRRVVFSPDGKMLASIAYQGNQGDISLWDIDSGTQRS